MKPLLLLLYFLLSTCLAHHILHSKLSDCSLYQPFEVVRDDADSIRPPQIVDEGNSTDAFLYTVNFYLYTRYSREESSEIFINDVDSIKSAKYGRNLPLVIIVHGWLGSQDSGSSKVIRSAFFHENHVENVNVIVVDWSGLASDESYLFTPAKVPYVGQKIAEFLNWIIPATGGNWDSVHMIGYDLGAHAVSYAARNTNGKVRRITGLDPTAPCFKGTVSSLTKSDAKYVEVIHTDCAYIRSIGILEPIGSVDFYPNNCNLQPGCDDYICSHTRAYELFAATVIYNNLVGQKCNSFWDALKSTCNSTETLQMGNDLLDKTGDGIYTLKTTSDWPFDIEPQTETQPQPSAKKDLASRRNRNSAPRRKNPASRRNENSALRRNEYSALRRNENSALRRNGNSALRRKNPDACCPCGFFEQRSSVGTDAWSHGRK